MLDLEDIFGHGGPLARALPDFKVRREQLRMAQRVADALDGARVARGRGRHRHRQDLRLPGAGAAVGRAGADLHRHAHAPGPAVRQGPAAGGRGHRPPGARGAAQGPRQLPVPLSPRAQRRQTPSSWTSPTWAPPRTRAAQAMLARIQRWARTTRRGDLAEVRGLSDSHPRVAAGHLDARELPGSRAARSSRAATWCSRGARRSMRTSSSSIITCCWRTWRSRRMASATCWAPPMPSFSMRRTRSRISPRSSSART